MKTQCKAGHSSIRRRAERVTLGALVLGLISVLVGPGAEAAPQGGQVVHGDAEINQSGSRTTIRQSSQDAILEYESFDIGASEAVEFVQPGTDARALNRVVGGDASNIAGRLTANGQVYLLNPSGIVFTDSAQIDVGGLYAAAGEMSNSDFLEGHDRFTNLTGEVVNYGTIQGGDLHLLGQRVANFGDLSTDGGAITMLAGDTVVIRSITGQVHVEVDGKKLLGDQPREGVTKASLSSDPAVENAGTIDANGGQATLGAGDMYSLAVRNSGSLNSAGGVVQMAATDGAVHNTGEVSADVSDGQAGSIDVQAPTIASEGTISASAATGQGGDVSLLAQDQLVLGPDSRVAAAGLASASGGEVIVNTFAGHSRLMRGAVIDVTGGADGGAGGFAEFSGQSLTLDGEVVTAGTTPGRFLIDLFNIDIVSGDAGDGADDDTLEPGPGVSDLVNSEVPPVDDATITTGKLESIADQTLITLEADNDINLDAPLSFSSSQRKLLTLDAGNDININEPVSDVFRFTLDAGNNINVGADLTNIDSLNFSAANDVNLAGEILQSGGLTIVSQNGVINLDASGIGGDGFLDIESGLSNTQVFDGPVRIAGAVRTTADDRFFNGTVRSMGESLGSLVSDRGSTSFEAAVGDGGAPLAMLRVNRTVVGGDEITTLGNQTYKGTVQLKNPVTFNIEDGGTVQFDRSLIKRTPLSQRNTELASATINGNARFNQRVGPDPTEVPLLPPSRLDGLTVNGQTTLDLADNGPLTLAEENGVDPTAMGRIWTAGPQAYNGPVVVESDAHLLADESIEINGPVTGLQTIWLNSNPAPEGGRQPIELTVGDIGEPGTPLGSIALSSNGGFTTINSSQLIAQDDILLNANPVAPFSRRDTVSELATIAVPNDDLTVESKSGSILMGQNETLSVVGEATFEAPMGTVGLSDVSTLGDLNVTAQELAINATPGTNFVIGGQPVVDVTDGTRVSPGEALISSVDPLIFADASDVAGSLTTQENVALTSADFFNLDGAVLNLEPQLPGSDANLAETTGDLEPEDVDPGEASNLILSLSEQQALAALGFEVQRTGEAQLTTQGLLDDTGGQQRLITAAAQEGEQPTDALPTRVSVYRVLRAPALRAVRRYQAVFQDTDAEQIRGTLSELWSAYTEASDTAPTGEGWTKRLAQVDGDGLGYLRHMRGLMTDLRQAGFTRTERRGLLRVLSRRYKPEAMTAEQFAAAVLAAEPVPYQQSTVGQTARAAR